MPIRSAAMAAGTPAQQANALMGTPILVTLSTDANAPSGTTQANSKAIPSDMMLLAGTSVGSGTGYVLPRGIDNASGGTISPGDSFQVNNQGGNAVLVYPNASTGKVQGAGAGVGFSVANNKQAQFTYMGIVAGVETWAADLSA
jgi:hypothetical protein